MDNTTNKTQAMELKILRKIKDITGEN